MSVNSILMATQNSISQSRPFFHHVSISLYKQYKDDKNPRIYILCTWPVFFLWCKSEKGNYYEKVYACWNLAVPKCPPKRWNQLDSRHQQRREPPLSAQQPGWFCPFSSPGAASGVSSFLLTPPLPISSVVDPFSQQLPGNCNSCKTFYPSTGELSWKPPSTEYWAWIINLSSGVDLIEKSHYWWEQQDRSWRRNKWEERKPITGLLKNTTKM